MMLLIPGAIVPGEDTKQAFAKLCCKVRCLCEQNLI